MVLSILPRQRESNMAKNTAQKIAEQVGVEVLEKVETQVEEAVKTGVETALQNVQPGAPMARPGNQLKQAPNVDMSKYAHLATKSDKIRAMHADGIAKADIGRLLDIRYQHVRNVLTQPMKKQMNQPAASSSTDTTKAA